MNTTQIALIDVFDLTKAPITPKDLAGLTITCKDKTAKLGKPFYRQFTSASQVSVVYEGVTDSVAVKLSCQLCTQKPESKIVKEGCSERLGIDGERPRNLREGSREMDQNREWRVIATEFLHPVTKLNELSEVKHVGWLVLHAIHHLDQAGIHYGNLSPGNIGYRKLPCGRILVNLFDFDFVTRHHVEERQFHYCPSTFPFAAIEVLRNEDVKFLVRFDFESLIWVLIWILVCYEGGKERRYSISKHPLRRWFNHQMSSNERGCHKSLFLDYPGVEKTRSDSAAEDFLPLAKVITEGYSLQFGSRRYRPDGALSDTLCGQATFEALRDVLVKGMWNSLDKCEESGCTQCPPPEQ
ncbi:hypothetical protein FRC03_000947 [Tulasnella sp. 419]|nr:hypothetical protein FRC03_000947 [Tulasnella sp. 419]